MRGWVQSWRPRTDAFCYFSSPVSKVLRLPRKSDARSYKVLHLSHNQNATTLRKSTPGSPNISDEHVSCTAPTVRHASLRILDKCPTPAIVLGNATKPSSFAHSLSKWAIPCACHAKWHLSVHKCSVPVIFFALLTSKCASRHNGVQFFISHPAKPTCRPSRATNHWKNTMAHDFLLSRKPASSFSWLFLASDFLSYSLFFSDSSHLCFFICPYRRKFDF